MYMYVCMFVCLRYKIELHLSSRNSFEEMVGIALVTFSLEASFLLPQFYEASTLPRSKASETLVSRSLYEIYYTLNHLSVAVFGILYSFRDTVCRV